MQPSVCITMLEMVVMCSLATKSAALPGYRVINCKADAIWVWQFDGPSCRTDVVTSPRKIQLRDSVVVDDMLAKRKTPN
jgi:hypothetical protein